jgi:hypothetical protein
MPWPSYLKGNAQALQGAEGNKLALKKDSGTMVNVFWRTIRILVA